MATKVVGSIRIERIPGDCRWVRLIAPLYFYSDVLYRACEIPAGFVYDEESVPLVKGTNPEAGAIHDYLCRIDSSPVVDGKVAAEVYQEMQEYYDSQESGNWFNRGWDWIRRKVKTWAVVAFRGSYFHQHKVGATYEEMSG